MADIAIFRINYKSDFILTLQSDAGWMTPFCIKFWTGAPSQAYFAGYDGTTYTHCAPVEGDPTKLVVQFDDHHLPIGDLMFQIGYHFTVADFPTSVEDEVLNQASVIIEQDGEPAQVMLDFNGETAPEIEFSLPAYANEAQRIANEQERIEAEQHRIANEEARIAAETVRQQNEEQRIQQETARVNEFARLKQDSETATADANAAATLANEKAQLAADKAALAQAAAILANEKAQLAADKAVLAQAAAGLANAKAALAQQKAEYAQSQGDYAKAHGDYAKEQAEIAEEDHERAEADHEQAASDHTTAAADHTRAESDHGIAVDDHTQAGNDHSRAESDHSTASADHITSTNDHTQAVTDHSNSTSDHAQAGSDHTRAESDHTRAESDHAAVEVYVDSLGAFDISSYHATDGVLAKYADLTAALGTGGANIPDDLRKGGMSVKFVQSSDNKYIQARCMAQNFTTDITQWQGVDDEPTAGSDNLVKSGGVDEKKLSKKGIYSDLAFTQVDNYYIKNDFTQSLYNEDGRYYGYVPVSNGDVLKITGYNLSTVIFGALIKKNTAGVQIVYASATSGSFRAIVTVLEDGILYVNGNTNYGTISISKVTGYDQNSDFIYDDFAQSQINIANLKQDVESVGTYNVTYNVPLSSGYYNLSSARAVVPVEIRKAGLIIIFEADSSHWEEYQYIANTLGQWTDNNFWQKLYVTTNPDECPVYNVTYEIPLSAGSFYTFATARAAIPASVRKIGLIMTYRESAYVWRTWQFMAITSVWDDDSRWYELDVHPHLPECFDEKNQSEDIGQQFIKISAVNGDYTKLIDSNGNFIPVYLKRIDNDSGSHRIMLAIMENGGYKNISTFYSSDASIYTGVKTHYLDGNVDIQEKWINFEVTIDWDKITTSKLKPSSVYYGITLNTAYFYQQIVSNQSPSNLSGKRILMFGASNVGYRAQDANGNWIGIDQRIFCNTGADVYNCGFGGNSMANRPYADDYNYFTMCYLADFLVQDNPDYTVLTSAIERLIAAHSSVPYYSEGVRSLQAAQQYLSQEGTIITIAYGGGDWSSNVPEGTNDSLDVDTFKGAMNYVIKTLHTKYPLLKIVFLTPLYRGDKVFPNNAGMDSDDNPNNINLYRWSYGEFMKDIGKINHQVVYDMYYKSGRDKYNINSLTRDEVHANEAGQKQEAEIYSKLLTSF